MGGSSRHAEAAESLLVSAESELEAAERPLGEGALVHQTAGLRLRKCLTRKLTAVVLPPLSCCDEREGAEQSALGVSLAGLARERQPFASVLGGRDRPP